MPRRPDRITVEGPKGLFDRFSSLTITNDLFGQTEATFELGDDGAWPALEQLVAPGQEFRVYLNGRPRLVGRAEVNTAPGSSSQGVRLSLTVRTKMSDAYVRSAPSNVRIEGAKLIDFVLACYEPLGLVARDFNFQAFTARDLMTGKSGPSAAPANFESITLDQAKVQPPETIRDAVEKHLRRFHASHWDGPDGRIVVGIPDAKQRPTYRLQAVRGARSAGNNVLSFERIRDWTEVVRSVGVQGQSMSVDEFDDPVRVPFHFSAIDDEVDQVAKKTGHFNRDVTMGQTQAKSAPETQALALRELSMKRRRMKAYQATVDGWTYWNGAEQIPWATNAVADIDIDALGPEGRGAYLITKTVLGLSTSGSCTAQLTLVGPSLMVF